VRNKGEETGVDYLFLLAGQSNMAGRGIVEEQDRLPHPRVLALDQGGDWVPAIDPIHFDKPFAGVGPGRTFGITLAEADPTVTVRLIPCATGGSPLSAWRPGEFWDQTRSHPYDDTISRTRRAMEDGVLKGILWHQGEGDCNAESARDYAANLEALISRLRKDLEAPGVPFIIGQLGPFLDNAASPYVVRVNDAHISVAQKIDGAGFVASTGLTSVGDNLHFDARSQREFGRRYAEVYQRLATADLHGDSSQARPY
jgi:hypothetical protein